MAVVTIDEPLKKVKQAEADRHETNGQLGINLSQSLWQKIKKRCPESRPS
jgi:hypothetical protein